MELAGGGTLPAMLLFALLVLVVFNYVLPIRSEAAAAPVLWASIVLGALLGFSNLFLPESEDEAASALLMAPIDPGIVYLGKLAGAIVLLAMLEVVLVPAFVVLYRVPLDLRVARLLVPLFLGTVGVAGVGTVVSAMSQHLRGGGFLVSTLALPVLVPIVVTAAAATRVLLSDEGSFSSAGVLEKIALLAVADLLFIGASALLYRFVLSKE